MIKGSVQEVTTRSLIGEGLAEKCRGWIFASYAVARCTKDAKTRKRTPAVLASEGILA